MLDGISEGKSLPLLSKIITQQKINLYAEASGDYNPIHIDESFAAQTALGGTIAHGMLILAYLSELMTQAFGLNWISGGTLSIRFKSPARPGDTVTVSGTIDTIEHEKECTNVNCSLACHNQQGEIIVTGNAMVKLDS
jgi:3-hydroxybutyryl-CoA dehydratase